MAEQKKPKMDETVGQESMEDMVRSIKQDKKQRAMEKEVYGPKAAPVAPPKKYAKGGSVGTASKRADGIAQRGKTRGKMV